MPNHTCGGGWLVDRNLTKPVKVNHWGGWPVDRKLPNEPKSCLSGRLPCRR
ncbi:hypothetical protein [Spirosoma pulveris]